MLEVERLLRDKYYEFEHRAEDKDYLVRLYLWQDEIRNYYTAVIRLNDLQHSFSTFLDSLVIHEDFVVYHVLILEDSVDRGMFVQLHNMQVEVSAKGYVNPVRMVPEFTVMRFNQFTGRPENGNNDFL